MRISMVTVLFLAFIAPFSEGTEGALELPYVYTEWKQFTVEDGLPNDHIFAVAVDDPNVWVGTENGLARLDKRTGEIESPEPVPQDKSLQIRYTRNADFTDAVANEYLDRLPSPEQVRVALETRDTSKFLRPFVG